MWNNAVSFALPEKLTRREGAWRSHIQPFVQQFSRQVKQMRSEKIEPTTLEWAKKITKKDIDVLKGKKRYNRDAPKADVEKLKLLLDYVEKGQFITKIRKVFTKGEMNADLEFVPAKVNEWEDKIEYYSILPTSPP
jgi:hypothetical protein